MGFPVEFGRKFTNPFRTDNKPDCCFYLSHNQVIFFVDFAYKDYGGDCWKIVQLYYNCDFYNALRHVNRDFGIGIDDGHIDSPVIRLRTIELQPIIREYQEKIYSDIRVLTMDFNQVDLDYWNQYEITKEQLIKFDVFSCFKSWINGNFYFQWSKKEPQYAYRFDDKTFQIYRPNSKNNKWITNTSNLFLHGYRQLTDKGDLLIWTKSRKDLICISNCGYNVVAVPSEGTIPEINLIKELKQRFVNHTVLFDNDEPGINYSDKFSKILEVKQIFMPEGTKDVSDFVKTYSLMDLKIYLDDKTRI